MDESTTTKRTARMGRAGASAQATTELVPTVGRVLGSPQRATQVLTSLAPVRPSSSEGQGGDGTSAGAGAATLGRYSLLAVLGAGASGSVHLALDPTGRPVALKVLSALRGDSRSAQRFAKEVRALGRVSHPNVVRILEHDLEGAVPFVVTELVSGRDLARVLDERSLTPEELRVLSKGLAGAVRASHASGVLHGDVKPSNVVLSALGPVLVDFGLASEVALTQTTSVLGTPGFTAPEVLRGGAATNESDWWSWAATVLQAATGRAPFGAGGVEVVHARVLRGDADARGLEPGLAKALLGSLHPDPRQRESPEGVLKALGLGEPGPRAVPRKAQLGLLASGALAALTASAVLAPPTAALVVLGLGVVLRVLGRAALRGDRGARVLKGSLRTALRTVPWWLLSAGAAVVVALVAGGGAWGIAVGAGAGLGVALVAPGSKLVREGFRAGAAALAPTRATTALVVVLLAWALLGSLTLLAARDWVPDWSSLLGPGAVPPLVERG